MKFRIDSFYTFDLRLPDDLSFSLITGTPIIIRISREKYQAYGIRPKQDYDYIYWRSEYPLDLFTIHLKNNLQKKFSSYFGADDHLGQHISELFNKFKFKKQISTRLFINNSEQIIIGTLWEFIFEGWGDKKLIEFALDVGLGERNPLGFGFMNLIY
jgi:CRISPR-associated endoribonuclease Cas6